MSEPSAEELDRLLEVQRVDSGIRRLRHRLATLDEQQRLDAALARAAGIAERESELAQDLDVARREQARIEGEVAALMARRDEERVRLYGGGLTAAREVQAVEAEIASTERRIGEHEDELLTVLERVDALEAAAAGVAAEVGAVAAEVAALEAARDGMAALLLADLAAVESERAALAAVVPLDLLARYEEAAERGAGVGVGRLEHNGCTACGNTLPSRVVGELLAGPSLALCPQCHRLLVLPA